MPLETLRGFSERIEADVFDVLTLDGSVASRSHVGGTAPDQVRAAVARARERLRFNHAEISATSSALTLCEMG